MEFSTRVDQKAQEVVQFLAEHAATFRRQGKVHPSWRCYKGRRLGPFFRLLYRQGGKQKAVYLGRDLARAEAVVAALREMQGPLLEARGLRKQLQEARKAFRDQKRELDSELRRVGLHLKGNEIRGWRGVRRLIPAQREGDGTRGEP